MKVAIDVRCLQDKYWTGVAENTWHLIEELVNLPQPPTLFFYANGWQRNNLPKELQQWGHLVATHYPNKLQDLGLRLGYWPKLDQIISSRSSSVDLFWLPNLHFFQLSKVVKKVLTIHDLSFIHFPQFFSAKKRWWYLSSMKKMLQTVKDFDAVVAVSEHTKNDILELKPQLEGRIKVIHPAVDPIFFKQASEHHIHAINQQYDLPEKYLLSVGTVEPRKNHLLLLKAYQELINQNNSFRYDLVIAGAFGWSFGHTLKYWQQMKSKNRVHFIGYVPRELQPALYQKASLFLYPSFYEGFGFPVLEAIASGTPCLVSNTSSLPEVVGEAALLLDPWVVSEWQNGINLILFNQKLKDSLRKSGKTQALKFSWQTSAQQLNDLFKAI
ncbi:MAG: glycosyltransferase family 1 protein [Patescibacteria group bacterium]